jgi:IstB-like ATP binding protein
MMMFGAAAHSTMTTSHGEAERAYGQLHWRNVPGAHTGKSDMPLTVQQAADLLEVIEDRVQRRSTIVTSQLPIALWHEALGEPTLADGISLLHNAHRVPEQSPAL